MWGNGKQALHILYTSSGFQNSVFIRDKSAESLSTDLINCWASAYIRFPEIIRLNRDTSFRSYVKTLRIFGSNSNSM